jgi:hypothetical protein
VWPSVAASYVGGATKRGMATWVASSLLGDCVCLERGELQRAAATAAVASLPSSPPSCVDMPQQLRQRRVVAGAAGLISGMTVAPPNECSRRSCAVNAACLMWCALGALGSLMSLGLFLICGWPGPIGNCVCCVLAWRERLSLAGTLFNSPKAPKTTNQLIGNACVWREGGEEGRS